MSHVTPMSTALANAANDDMSGEMIMDKRGFEIQQLSTSVGRLEVERRPTGRVSYGVAEVLYVTSLLLESGKMRIIAVATSKHAALVKTLDLLTPTCQAPLQHQSADQHPFAPPRTLTFSPAIARLSA